MFHYIYAFFHLGLLGALRGGPPNPPETSVLCDAAPSDGEAVAPLPSPLPSHLRCCRRCRCRRCRRRRRGPPCCRHAVDAGPPHSHPRRCVGQLGGRRARRRRRWALRVCHWRRGRPYCPPPSRAGAAATAAAAAAAATSPAWHASGGSSGGGDRCCWWRCARQR
ncbi:hypothetical protein I4F81_007016 [Pyropia yezoensis]|uniref:Uncharacterized protein n=1 Tax=Pyropia yezoensis TaxID=2788 RepID=A0ACC3C3B0_PYRYE|nr:hypothetical protein I4F81_007016 [Neopyropia yezoensis]